MLLATSTIGALSLAALLHVDRAAEAAAWRTVGADYQITRPDTQPLRAKFDFSSLPDVDASATMFLGSSTLKLFAAFPVVALIDLSAYELVVAGTPGEEVLPRGALRAGRRAAADHRVRRLVATRADGQGRFDRLDDDPGLHLPGQVVGTRASFPGIPPTDFFIIANRDQVLGLFPPRRPTQFAFFAPRLRRPPTFGVRSPRRWRRPAVAGRVELTDNLRDSPVTAARPLGITIAADRGRDGRVAEVVCQLDATRRR